MLGICPYPVLSETQADVIALDYGMRGGKAEIQVNYARKRLGLDSVPAASKPQDQQIVLANRDALFDRRKRAREQ
jgi:hypothetical protein